MPEAQLDRFMLNIQVGYPGELEEREVLDRTLAGEAAEVAPVMELSDVLLARVGGGRGSRRAATCADYIVQRRPLDTRSRPHMVQELSAYVEFGASPRTRDHGAGDGRAGAGLALEPRLCNAR